MVVVIAVILVLVGLVLPAASTMWNQRKIAEAHNTIQGVLRTTRAKAAQGQRGDMGVLFFVDDKGIQRLATIARNPFDPDNPPPAMQDPATLQFIPGADWQTNLNWRDVFTVTPERPQSLPPGMRVVPQYALVDETAAQQAGLAKHEFFLDAELANQDFANLPAMGDQAQRHRNYFAVIFAADGRLITDRDILVRDTDLDPSSAAAPPLAGDPANPAYHGYGDGTGLLVAPTATPPVKFYATNGTPTAFPSPEYPPADSLVIDPGDAATALSFVPVDGLMVYDDSLFREAATDAEKRATLLDTGQPFYVHHLTGAIVKGPTGENQ
jgi:hypothetical protein